jgi:hypothetical protein
LLENVLPESECLIDFVGIDIFSLDSFLRDSCQPQLASHALEKSRGPDIDGGPGALPDEIERKVKMARYFRSGSPRPPR